jgi:hypothetical protein
MHRSEDSKRTLDLAALTVGVGSLLGVLALASIGNIQPGRPLTSGQLIGALILVVSFLMILLGSLPFYEDLKQLEVPSGERRMWELGWLVMAPLAVAAYWFRHVRQG